MKFSLFRRSQAESMASSVPESTSSMESESENDDSVWGITNEQRDYYTNHFRKLQPVEGEVLKGTLKFLKSCFILLL